MPLQLVLDLDQQVAEPAFDDVLWTLLFVTCVWVVGKLVTAVGVPTLVGEIAVGVLLGPHVLNWVPQWQALMLYGEVGLILLVVEAGLDVDLEVLKLLGPRGVAVALTGSLTPLAIGFGLSHWGLGLPWLSALAVGCALAPTSMGIAVNVLKKGKALNTPTGQLVVAAAVLDDVIALVLLAELQALENPRLLRLVLPVISSVVLMAGFGWFGTRVIPLLFRRVLPRVAPKHREKLLLGLLLFLAIVLIPAAHQMGSSHLLGCFLAGFSFCTDPHVRGVWSTQLKRLLQWLLRLFFACTIGFEIPVRQFASAEVVHRACVFFIAILGKVSTGVWAVPLSIPEFFKVGFAMATWGEFAFIVATSARSRGLIDQLTFSALILAVVLSILLSPMLLRLTLRSSERHAAARLALARQESIPKPRKVAATRGEGVRDASRRVARANHDSDCDDGDEEEGGGRVPLYFRLVTRSAPAWGLNARLMERLAEHSLQILDFRSQHDEDAANPRSSLLTNELYLRDPATRAPPLLELPPTVEGEVRDRINELLAAISTLFTDGGTATVERWVPGVTPPAEPAGELTTHGDAYTEHRGGGAPWGALSNAGSQYDGKSQILLGDRIACEPPPHEPHLHECNEFRGGELAPQRVHAHGPEPSGCAGWSPGCAGSTGRCAAPEPACRSSGSYEACLQLDPHDQLEACEVHAPAGPAIARSAPNSGRGSAALRFGGGAVAAQHAQRPESLDGFVRRGEGASSEASVHSGVPSLLGGEEDFDDGATNMWGEYKI